MTSDFDLDAYLARIGYGGPRAASLDVLTEVHRRHPAAVPFENLDPLLRRPVRLDTATLQQKLVHDRRGGYCYEQNLLFRAALTALGFDVHGLAARVLWNAPPDIVRPRSHMLMRVEIDGTSYVADVGFGGLTLTSPLRLDTDAEQPTAHERFRLVPHGRDRTMQARVGNAWKDLYRFGDEEHFLPDYEMANWYTSTHPDSHFLTTLVAARAVDGKRFALMNNQLATHHLNGPTERRTLRNAPEIAAALEDVFEIALPDDAGLAPVLKRLAQGSA